MEMSVEQGLPTFLSYTTPSFLLLASSITAALQSKISSTPSPTSAIISSGWSTLLKRRDSSDSSVPSITTTLQSKPLSLSTPGLTPTSSSTVAAPTPVRNTGKRGLAYTNDTLTMPYSLSGQKSHVSWAYNWYNEMDSETFNPALTFIPLLFDDAAASADVWIERAQAAIDEGADALFAFNEPDLCHDGSACMNISRSVAAYRTFMQPFAGHVRLGSPAVTNGAAPFGLTYLSWFMDNCTDCTVDFINLHWYSNTNAFTDLQSHILQAYRQFNLPIWVTELGIASGGGTDAQIEAFLQQALPWLDAVPFVERYAYFYDGPGYLIDANASGMSTQGKMYNSFTASCTDWNNTEGHC